MQELVTHLLRTVRFWVYLGDAAHPYNVFDFTVNHKSPRPTAVFGQLPGLPARRRV